MPGHRQTLRSFTMLMLVAASIVLMSACHEKPQAVTTYHYDNFRTGWNSHEERLTPDKVAARISAGFRLSHSTIRWTPNL